MRKFTQLFTKFLPLLFAFCGLFGVSEDAWGYSSTKLTVTASGSGTVAVTTSNTAPASNAYGSSKSANQGPHGFWDTNVEDTYYVWVSPNSGYRCTGVTDGTWNNGGYYVVKAPGNLSKSNPNEKNVTATFVGNSYTISFEGNGNTSGSMSDQSGFVYGTGTKLNDNKFGRAYTVTYDANGGSCGTSSATATYTFNGWKSSDNTSYANQANISTFSPAPGHNATVTLTAQWTSASVTLPSATKDGAVLEGWYVGSIAEGNKITTATYTPTANVTLVANWINKYDFEITGDDYTINNEAWNKTSAFNFVHADEANMTTTIEKTDVISYDRAKNTITALKIGTSKITFTQNTSSTVKNGSFVFTITVDSVANTLAVSNTSFTCYVDTANFANIISNKNSDATVTTTSTDASIAYYKVSEDKIYVPNNEAKSFSETTVTLHIKQAGTGKYKAVDKTITLTVKKRPNPLTCSWGSWSKDINVDSETGVTISANNALTPIVIEQTSGDTEGNVIATYSSANNKITSIYNIGTATWSVSQAENYKYVAAETKTLTVNVKKASQPTCYVVDHADEQSVYSMWGQGDEYCEAIALNGVGESLVSFEAKKDGGTGDVSVVQYSKDNGQNWTTLRSAFGISSDFQEFGPFAFPALANGERITHIRFGVSATTSMISYRYKNIKVSRKKWFKLEDKDGNEISSLEMPTNTLGGNHTTAKFTVNYSTCADQIKVVSNHPHITVSPASFASEGNGTKEITVTYACDEPESIDGIITVYTPYENKTINVHAATEKKSQEIEWSDLFAGETVSLPQTFTSDNAASATSKLPVTYTSGNSEIIEVAEDSLSFTVVGTGTTTLTAKQSGNDLWKSTSDTKTINASNKKIQRIKWNQQFTRSLAPGQEIPLTATVTVLNIATGVETESVERSAEIVYSCPADNGVIEIVDGTNIRVLGYNNTTITASVAGNEDYEAAAPVTLPVRVREIQTGDCDMPLVLEQNNEIEFFQGNTQQITGSAIAINHANGIPDKLSFDVRGAAWTLGIEYYKGGIIAQQSIDNQMNWSDLTPTAVSPAKGETVSSDEIQLNPNATHIRFIRPSGGQGYHYVGNIHITRLPYLETESATIDLGNISVGEKRDFTIPVSYCSVRGNMSISKQYSDNGLTIEDAIEAECGDMSSYDLQASVTSSVVGPWTNMVTVRDPLSNMYLNVTVNATIQKGDQVITWNPSLDILTTETPELNAVASSRLAVSYAVTSGNNTVARIDNGQVVVLQPGLFAITASQGGNSNYNAAPAVVKEFTVTAETLKLLEAPTASDITYGQALSASTLTGGSVEDSKHNLVAGTFSWQAASTQPNAGSAQNFIVVFTPDENAAWYNTLTTNVAVNVAAATPVATPSAANIVYGKKVNESVLSNEGTAGTWSWTDAKAEDVLDAGTYNDLAVHFTPASGNYTELDATVSLTVEKANPAVTAQASAITYGQPISASELSTATGNISGTWAWAVDEEQVLSVGNHALKANFTSANANYSDLSNVDVTLTVNKIEKLEVPVALSFCAGGEVTFHGNTYTEAGEYHIEAEGATRDTVYNVTVTKLQPTTGTDSKTITVGASESWNGKDLSGYAVGSHEVEFHTTNAAGCDSTVTLSLIVVPASNVFTNADGDGDWSNPDNWESGIVPTSNPDIIVTGALEINDSITVGSLTIESTGSVAVISGGTLTVNGTSEDRDVYGDVHVMSDGALALGNSADLQVRHFTLDAKLGDADNAAASGQVSNEEKMRVNGSVYFQLSFDPANAISYGWYDFTVPFPVNVIGGIERVNSSSDKVMVSGQDFLLMEDDEVSYVNGGKGWRQISSGALVPGKLYTITFDDEVNQNTFRFAWNGQGELTNGERFTAQYLTSSDASRNGWNAVGNAMLRHGYIGGDYKIQAYNHTDNVYEIIDDPKTFAVGTAFFIQVEEAGDIDWTPAEATLGRPIYAPKRAAESVEEFRLSLMNEEAEKINDVLFFSASEEATEAYKIGHDLLKKGTPTEAKKAQMWSTKGGKNLCDVEATLVNNKATTPLSFYTPKAGSYWLAIDEAPENASLYLTYNGSVIWDLTISPYLFDLSKGTTEGYGLRMGVKKTPTVTTDIEEAEFGGQGMRKVIIDNHVYVVTPEGKMYDIIGKGIKF